MSNSEVGDQAIGKSVDLFRLAFDESPDVVAISRVATGLYLDVNRRFSETLGYSREELIGRSAEELGIWLNPLDRRRFIDTLRLSRRVNDFEAWFRAKDGHHVAGLLSAAIIIVKGEPLVLTMTRDVTALARSQEAMQRTERLSALGVLAGGIAHDFNNVLTAIFGNVSAAQELLPRGHEALAYLEDVGEAIDLAKHLTNQLLTFSRGGEPSREPVCLVSLAQETVRFVLSGSHVGLHVEEVGPRYFSQVDAGQFRQVFSNLALNALQAMPEGGDLFLRTELLTGATVSDLGLMAERYLKISLRDTGQGMAPTVRDQIFDPYFTTKESGRGLGMAIVHSIMTRHQGRIEITSEPGAGTEICLYVPVDGEVSSEVSSEVEARGTTAGLRILVLDDEPLIRRALQRMLRRLGHHTDVAAEGAEAVRLFTEARTSGAPFDLLIMDLTIAGGLGGKAALERILAEDPDAVALVSSGYSHDPVVANYADYGFKGVLAKPFTAAELEGEIERVMTLGATSGRSADV